MTIFIRAAYRQVSSTAQTRPAASDMRVRPSGRFPGLVACYKNFTGPLRGRAGSGEEPNPCENLGMRPRTRVKHFGLSEPHFLLLVRASFRNVPRTTEHAVKDFRRVPFFGSPFLGTQER